MTPQSRFQFFLFALFCSISLSAKTSKHDTLAVTLKGYSYWVIRYDMTKENKVHVVRQKDSVLLCKLEHGYKELGDCNWRSETSKNFHISNDTLFYYVSYSGNNMNVYPGNVRKETRTKYTYVFTESGTLELRRTQQGHRGGPIWKEVELRSLDE